MIDMLIDQKQRKQALSPDQSFIVQAPAGSGKTELLTQRFLRLLACVDSPEKILAITFTRKAANQMRTRILTALENTKITEKTHPLVQQVLQQDQKYHWQLLKNPNRLCIQTIDSFCAKLTRQMPILSQLGAQFTISDHPENLYQQAAMQTLLPIDDNAHWSAAAKQLLFHCDNQFSQAITLLHQMLAKRDQWLSQIIHAKNQTQLRQTLEKGLFAITQEAIKNCQQTFPQDLEEEIQALMTFAKQSSFSISQKDDWIQLSHLLMNAQGDWRKRVDKSIGFPAASTTKDKTQKEYYQTMKKRMEGLLKKISTHNAFRESLIALRQTPPSQYRDAQWKTLTALLTLLPIAVAQLKLVFRELGETDYIENALAALTALGDAEKPTDLALILDNQIQHILIDEFQDTSISQFHLMEKLIAEWTPGDGRTLFVVGDPMQSIYRFRDAEVGLFLRAKQVGIGTIQLKSLTLQMNFRSEPSLVNWFNQTFEKLFPVTKNLQAGAVNYNAATAAITQTQKLYAKLHPLLHSDDEAEQIAQLIQQIKQTRPQDTMAILVKARHHLTKILPCLRAHQISYQAVEIDALHTRPVIQDLLALTKALFNLGDRIAWLSILRTPWCGLTLTDLHVIGSQSKNKTIWETLQQPNVMTQLSTDGKNRLLYIIEKLSYALAQRARLSCRHWIMQTWLSLKGNQCVSHPIDLQDVHTYFDCLESLSVSGEIKDFKQLEVSLATLFSAANMADDPSCQIMTIHKAKGLEFDTVILPGLERTSPKPAPQLLLWTERIHPTNDLILAPIRSREQSVDEIYQYLYREELTKNRFENLRLLYVAATRAKKQLHLFGTAIYDQALKTPPADSFLRLLWPLVKSEFEQITHSTSAAIPLPEKPSNAIRRLPSDQFTTETFKLSDQTSKLLTPEKLIWTKTFEPYVGILIHKILQHMSHQKIKIKPQDKKRWRTLCRQAGIMPPHTDPAVHQVTRAIQNTLSDPRGQWILAAHKQAQSEYPVSTTKQKNLQRFIIDRTFIDEKNRRWIIDYKTDHFPGENLETWLQQEKQRHLAQLKNYARILKQIYPEKTHFGLYFPLIPAWIEWT